MFGGDMIEGVMIYPTQPYEIDATLFEQKAAVSCLLADTVRAALAAYDRVTVTGEWGNHGRMGSKRDAVPASDNHDRECYEMARIMLSNEKRLVWEDCPEDIQRVEIGNYRALLEHGDEAGRSGWTSETTFLRSISCANLVWASTNASACLDGSDMSIMDRASPSESMDDSFRLTIW